LEPFVEWGIKYVYFLIIQYDIVVPLFCGLSAV
jgi:hypothetical protein